MRSALTGLLIVALLLVGASLGRAFDRDQAVVTVQVSSADHEAEEGYFSLGEQATLMVKPGSDLFRFLNRNRGQKVRISLTNSAAPELSKVER